MGKFNLLTTLTLDAAGYNKGINQAKQKTKDLQVATDGVKKSVSGIFSGIGGMFGGISGQMGQTGQIAIQAGQALKSLIPAIHGIKAAFISTGIGAIVVAITLAIAGLVSWMTRTKEGGNVMKSILNSISAVISVFLDKIGKLGSALVKLFKGDFKGAADDVKSAFTGWGEALKDNLDKGDKLTKMEIDLAKRQSTYATDRQRILNEISELENDIRDESNGKTSTERLKALEKENKLKKDLFDLDYSIKDLEYQISVTKDSMGENSYEDDKKTNELLAARNATIAEYNEGLKSSLKLKNKLNSEFQKELELADKTIEANEKSFYDSVKPVKMDIKDDDVDIFADANLTPDLKPAIMELSTYYLLVGSIVESNKKLNDSFLNLSDAVAGTMGRFASDLAMGADSFKEYAQNMKNAIRGLIKALIAQTVAQAVAGQMAKLASNPFTLMAAPIVAALAAGLVSTAFEQLIPKFATGGIVGGSSFYGDRVPALVNSGEMILNRQQQSNLFNMLNSGYSSGGNSVEFEIKGDRLVGVLSNYGKKYNTWR